MRANGKSCVAPVIAIALLLGVTLMATHSATALVIPPGDLAATQSNSDLVLTFPTISPRLYTVQAGPNPLQWTNRAPVIAGDGTVKTVVLSNALSGSQGFCRLLIQTPAGLLLPVNSAFAILGYDCGGIQEQVYVTGFDPSTGNILGDVYLKTVCSCGKACSTTHTKWAAVTWDLTGNAVSAMALSNAPAVSTNFSATDATGDTIYNAGTRAYLVVPIPASPTGVTVLQSGDQFNVFWTFNGVNPATITSSTLTAIPLDNVAASNLTTAVSGSATSGVIPTLQPSTTYQITVVNATIAGSSPPSAPVSVMTSPATVLPSAPTNVVAAWQIPDPSGTTDSITVTWQSGDPGNSPIDEYQIVINGSDGGGTFTQTVSGTTLTAYFNSVDFIPNWSITVQAHNAAGWGPKSITVNLGGL